MGQITEFSFRGRSVPSLTGLEEKMNDGRGPCVLEPRMSKVCGEHHIETHLVPNVYTRYGWCLVFEYCFIL